MIGLIPDGTRENTTQIKSHQVQISWVIVNGPRRQVHVDAGPFFRSFTVFLTVAIVSVVVVVGQRRRPAKTGLRADPNDPVSCGAKRRPLRNARNLTDDDDDGLKDDVFTTTFDISVCGRWNGGDCSVYGSFS